MQELIINEELRTLLPPLSDEEYAGLEADILKNGCLSDLIVWNGILIDGHHRYEICKKHEIPFAVKNIVFDDIDAAKLWAWKHQEHRRNLTAYHRAEIALKLKDTIAAKAKERQRASGGDRKNADAKSVPSMLTEPVESKDTRQELAEIAGVSSGTLTKSEYITEHADEETKQKLRKGEKGTSINKEYKRLKEENEEKASEPDTEFSKLFPNEKPGFKPGSPEEEKYSSKTQLKPIPRSRPDILVANLIAFFPQEFVPNTAREVFRQLFERYGKEVTKPLADEIYKKYGKK